MHIRPGSPQAAAHVHAIPVVHRDIKPYNLLISTDGTVALIDFGIAKPLGAHATPYTRHGSTVGSRGYQAPEQLLERQVTPRTDLYALGCVLYELLAGQPPFTGDRLADQHLHEPPLPIQVHAPGVPADLADLTLQLLAKEPESRPADAESVRDALSRYLPQVGDPEPSPRFVPDPTRPFREPSRIVRLGQAPSPARPAALAGSKATWLSRRDVEAALHAAEEALESDDAGDAAARLAGLAADAQRQWGRKDPLARAVRRKAADSLRLAGDCGRAGALYQELADMGTGSDAPADRADLAAGVLGAAECRIPCGDLAPAADAVAYVTRMLPRLSPDAARHLAARCTEVKLELSELGYRESSDDQTGQDGSPAARKHGT